MDLGTRPPGNPFSRRMAWIVGLSDVAAEVAEVTTASKSKRRGTARIINFCILFIYFFGLLWFLVGRVVERRGVLRERKMREAGANAME